MHVFETVISLYIDNYNFILYITNIYISKLAFLYYVS